MLLFDFFKSKRQVQDPLLGILTLYKGLWCGSTAFSPTGGEIDIFVSSESMPDERHRSFYQKIQAGYALLKPKLQAVLLDHYRNWQEDFKIKNFDEEFEVHSITLYSIESPAKWEMAFTSIYDDHLLTLTIIDMEPQEGVVMDG